MKIAYHYGIRLDGHIVATKGDGYVKDLGLNQFGITPAQIEIWFERNGGEPFEPLQGNPQPHRVMGRLKDGRKFSAADVEGVYNDWKLLDAICGAGTFIAVCSDVEREILEVAQGLYPSGLVLP